MLRKKLLVIFVTFFTFLGVHTASADTYKVDRDHTTVSFKIRHLFSNVQGIFRDFEGTIDYDPAVPGAGSAQGTIQVKSIDTNVPKRDAHLMSKDFFDVENFPLISFKATKAVSLTNESAKVEGLLTMHGIEKAVTLDVTIHGVGQDPWGKTRLGLTATTTINRKDFGIVYNQTLDRGQLMIGDEVTVTLEVEAVKE